MRDLVNVGYNATSGDAQLCRANGGEVGSAPASSQDMEGAQQGRPFACRLMQRVMDRLDASEIRTDRLTMTLSDTLKLYNPQGMGGGIPGSTNAIPGNTDALPGQPQPQPTATPVAKP